MRLYAHFNTSRGEFVAELYREHSPKIVGHFISLATGNPPWFDPRSETLQHLPFYRELPFHYGEVGAFVQTGCPLGNGRGFLPVPGLAMDEEPTSPLSHEVGSLSLASAGGKRMGGQFFLCQAPLPHFDGLFPVFGRVTEGLKRALTLTTADTLHSLWIEEY